MTEFAKQIQIDNYIKEMGLFLSENNLFMKIGNYDGSTSTIEKIKLYLILRIIQILLVIYQ